MTRLRFHMSRWKAHYSTRIDSCVLAAVQRPIQTNFACWLLPVSTACRRTLSFFQRSSFLQTFDELSCSQSLFCMFDSICPWRGYQAIISHSGSSSNVSIWSGASFSCWCRNLLDWQLHFWFWRRKHLRVKISLSFTLPLSAGVAACYSDWSTSFRPGISWAFSLLLFDGWAACYSGWLTSFSFLSPADSKFAWLQNRALMGRMDAWELARQ